MYLVISFYFAACLQAFLIFDLWRTRKAPWALPALMVYVTTIAWYDVDPIMYGEKYNGMPAVVFNHSYLQIMLFLGAFRWMVPYAYQRLATRQSLTAMARATLSPQVLFLLCLGGWAVLLTFGASRMNFDLVGALFPLDSRAGTVLWTRGAAGDAGPIGFLISTGGYLYLVVCSLFGILAVLLPGAGYKAAATVMIALTWPSFLLGGTRNQFLAVCMPWVFGYLLFGRQPKMIRLAVLVAVFLALNSAFLIVISHRNTGLRDFIAGTEDAEVVENNKEAGHEGLNMIQELCYINLFQETGQMPLTWGQDYMFQLANVVPRAIWPNKPMMGIEYAKLRGFGGANSDIGVFATVSTGMIGQGVVEYGPFAGPLAPALLLALWCGLLARWWGQRASILRLCLFLLALGVTFNLGRDITILTLWPVLFAYLMMRVVEKAMPGKRSQRAARRRRTQVTAPVPASAALLPAVAAGSPATAAGGLGQP